MSDTFFGFKKRPFVAIPSLDRYFPASSIEQAFQVVSRAIERAEGPISVIGGTGLGKSLLCMRVAETWQKRFDVVFLASSQLCSRRALLQNLLFELRLPYRDLSEGELRLSLLDRLQFSYENPSDGILVIVDEAQSLPTKLLEELRLLTNIVRDGVPRVRLVLVGNSRLDELLGHPRLESLNQRMAGRCYLQPLTADETSRMVQHKIELCGVNWHSVISSDALKQIYRATDGIPRLIDQLMDHALMLAEKRRQKPISSTLIEEAWSDLQQMPLPWSHDRIAISNASSVEFGAFEDDEDESMVSSQPLSQFQHVDDSIDLSLSSDFSSNYEITSLECEFDREFMLSNDDLTPTTCSSKYCFEEMPRTAKANTSAVESLGCFEVNGYMVNDSMFVFDASTFHSPSPASQVAAPIHLVTPPPQTNPAGQAAGNIFGEDFEEEFDLGMPRATNFNFETPRPVHNSNDAMNRPMAFEKANSSAFVSKDLANEYTFALTDDMEGDRLEADLRDIISGMNLESLAIDPVKPFVPMDSAIDHNPLPWEYPPMMESQGPEILSFSDLNEVDSVASGDDRDLLVIEEDIVTHSATTGIPSTNVTGSRAANPYCELFSKLRS